MSPTPPTLDNRQRRIFVGAKRLPVMVIDAAGGLFLFVLSLLPLGVAGVELGELSRHAPWWVPVVLAAGQTLPLLLRRTHPAIDLTIIGIAFAAAQLGGIATGVAGLGLFIAIYSFAAYQRRHRGPITLAAGAGYVTLAVALDVAGSSELFIDWVTFFLVLVIPWLVGQLVRRGASEQIARESAAAAAAVRDSRNALARDLHDIVTHHVTAIVVHADSTAYLEPGEIAERARALETIGVAGRRALQELRSLLGALEQSTFDSNFSPMEGASAFPVSPREPLPRSVADLAEEARAAGYPVAYVEHDALPPASEAVAVTLYRVTQEALTNAMKHSPGAVVEITMAGSGGRVELRVVNDIPRMDAGVPGRGRRGMADRVALLGGSFTSGIVDGRFEVIVRLDPLAEPAR